MANRPYAGVIKDFLERRHELMSARGGLDLYSDFDIDRGLPVYGLHNNATGLRLELTVPTQREHNAGLNLSNLGDNTESNPNLKPASLVGISFDWRSHIVHRVATIEPGIDTHLGRLVEGIGGKFVHPSYKVLSAYDALGNMFQIMGEKRKKVIDDQLGLNK